MALPMSWKTFHHTEKYKETQLGKKEKMYEERLLSLATFLILVIFLIFVTFLTPFPHSIIEMRKLKSARNLSSYSV